MEENSEETVFHYLAYTISSFESRIKQKEKCLTFIGHDLVSGACTIIILVDG